MRSKRQILKIHEVLAQLIVDNLSVPRWLFKVDDQFDGRGIAYFDVSTHLHCYGWCVKEAQRYGPDKWRKKWAQEAAYLKIMSELPLVLTEHAQTANRKAYPTWSAYIQAFLSQGGVIEACPPSDSVTSVSISLLIEPLPATAASSSSGSGAGVQLITSGDQIHAESEFSCWGLSAPQSSVDPSLLNDAALRVADACRARAIVGYVTVDFVTFIDPVSMKQELLATDLDLSYSDGIAMSRLLEFATEGRFEPVSHLFLVAPPKQEEKKTRRRPTPDHPKPSVVSRFAVLSTRLYHSNLTMVHYSVFFQMCRAHGIGFDIKEKQGTMFTLVHGAKREHLGMISIGETLQSVLATFASNLSVIHQEISAPNMQGQSNFKAAIKDIESILGTTIENAFDIKTEATT